MREFGPGSGGAQRQKSSIELTRGRWIIAVTPKWKTHYKHFGRGKPDWQSSHIGSFPTDHSRCGLERLWEDMLRYRTGHGCQCQKRATAQQLWGTTLILGDGDKRGRATHMVSNDRLNIKIEGACCDKEDMSIWHGHHLDCRGDSDWLLVHFDRIRLGYIMYTNWDT
jgi:hypothetical protein